MLEAKNNGTRLREGQTVKIKSTGKIGTVGSENSGKYEITLVEGGTAYVTAGQVEPTTILKG